MTASLRTLAPSAPAAEALPGEPEASYIDEPVRLDGRGATKATPRDGWLRELVLAVVLTRPGERVHRPDFGSGLQQLVFEPAGGEVASTVQFLVQGALQRWVGHLVDVEQVTAEAGESTLTLTVSYTVRRTGAHVEDEIEVPVP